MSNRTVAVAGQIARRAEHRPRRLLVPLARGGLAARAVVYLVLAVLAGMIVANGRPPSSASSSGALAEVEKQPAGPFLLGLLAAGLFSYALWRAFQSLSALEPSSADRPSAWKRVGWGFISLGYIGLFIEAVSILTANQATGGPTSHPEGYVARLLSAPGGPGWVGLLATGLAVGGGALVVWGILHDPTETLDTASMSRLAIRAAKVTSRLGNAARGALLLLVSGYFFYAALTERPSEAKGLDQALQSLARQPTGPVWICLLAAGLVSFGLSSGIEARYRLV